MPAPFWFAPVVTGLGSLLGGLFSGRGQSNAARYQYDSAQEALAFQRQQAARQWQQYQEQRDYFMRTQAARRAWNNPLRQAFAARYGFSWPGQAYAPRSGMRIGGSLADILGRVGAGNYQGRSRAREY